MFQGFGIRDSDFGFRGSGFGFRVSCFMFQISGFVFRVSGFRFRDSGFMFRVLGFGVRVSGFGSRPDAVLEDHAVREVDAHHEKIPAPPPPQIKLKHQIKMPPCVQGYLARKKTQAPRTLQ